MSQLDYLLVAFCPARVFVRLSAVDNQRVSELRHEIALEHGGEPNDSALERLKDLYRASGREDLGGGQP
jgi:hypothetical protein